MVNAKTAFFAAAALSMATASPLGPPPAAPSPMHKPKASGLPGHPHVPPKGPVRPPTAREERLEERSRLESAPPIPVPNSMHPPPGFPVPQVGSGQPHPGVPLGAGGSSWVKGDAVPNVKSRSESPFGQLGRAAHRPISGPRPGASGVTGPSHPDGPGPGRPAMAQPAPREEIIEARTPLPPGNLAHTSMMGPGQGHPGGKGGPHSSFTMGKGEKGRPAPPATAREEELEARSPHGGSHTGGVHGKHHGGGHPTHPRNGGMKPGGTDTASPPAENAGGSSDIQARSPKETHPQPPFQPSPHPRIGTNDRPSSGAESELESRSVPPIHAPHPLGHGPVVHQPRPNQLRDEEPLDPRDFEIDDLD